MTARDDAAGLRERVEALVREKIGAPVAPGCPASAERAFWLRVADELPALLAESTPAPAPAADFERALAEARTEYREALDRLADGGEVGALAALIVADTDEPMWSAVVIAKRILASPLLADIRRTARAEGAREADERAREAAERAWDEGVIAEAQGKGSVVWDLNPYRATGGPQ